MATILDTAALQRAIREGRNAGAIVNIGKNSDGTIASVTVLGRMPGWAMVTAEEVRRTVEREVEYVSTLTPSQRARYKLAGYSHFVEYDTWAFASMWVDSGFPTTADALPAHSIACRGRLARGEIRAVRIVTL